MEEEQKAEVTRRSLIRRVGTVAAGVGAAGIASAAVASPAQATDGQAVVQGQVNTGGNTTTTIRNVSGDKAALTLSNTDGAPLTLDVASEPVFTAPVGSVFADRFGSFYTVGDRIVTIDGPETVDRYVGVTSPAFSTSTSFVTPERWLVTIPNFEMPNGADGHEFIVSPKDNIQSSGRVTPRNLNNVPDLTLDFSPWFYEFGIFGVQGNLAVLSPAGNGFVSMYDTQVWPGSATKNFQANVAADGFTQMGFTPEGYVHFKLSQPAILVFDIFAFVVGNGQGRIVQQDAAAARSNGQSMRPGRMPKSAMPQRKK